MSDPPRYPDSDDATAAAGAADQLSGRPRWTKVALGILAIGALLLFIGLHVTGVFGPGLH